MDRIEPQELRDAAVRLLEKAVDPRAAYAEDGVAPAIGPLRSTMAELGWMLLTTPEELGGLGQSFSALAPIYEELGRALAPISLTASMVAIDVLSLASDAAEAAALLEKIGTGEAVFMVAFENCDPTVQGGAQTVRISAQLRNVMGGPDATHLLLFQTDGEASVLLVPLDSAGAAVDIIDAWDRSRPFSDIALKDAARTVLLEGAEAKEAIVLARAHSDLATASDSIGGADRALAEAIDYMGSRQQFNRPIGSFQALKHRAADLKVQLEIARAFVNRACEAFVARSAGWAAGAAQAKVIATEAYRAIAEESVQFHGGIGFTWEHDCHLFLKRALVNEMLGGTPEQYKDRVAGDVINRAFAGRAR